MRIVLELSETQVIDKPIWLWSMLGLEASIDEASGIDIERLLYVW